MPDEERKIPLFDIHEANYLEMNGIDPSLTLQDTRVVFEVPANEESYRLLQQYHANPTVRLLDFVRALKKLRARMLDVRDGKGKRRNGDAKPTTRTPHLF